MNKALIICSNFLPIRNGGTIRCDKLVKYLPFFGWNSIILTKKNNKRSSFERINNTNVYRSKEFDIATSLLKVKNNLNTAISKAKKSNNTSTKEIKNVNSPIRRRVSEYFLLPDADVFWALGAVFKGVSIVRKEKPKVILSSGPSHSVHIVGFFLKKIFKKYWVVEFRDPWTMNPFRISKPFRVLTYLDDYLEKIVLRNADMINVTSIEYKMQFLEKHPFLESKKITNIPNGFDPEDFNNDVIAKNEVLTIVHSGNFYQHRSSANFIKAVLYLLENNYIDASKILIKFVGIIDEQGKRIIDDSEYLSCFKLFGNVKYKTSIEEIRSADILLLIPGPGTGTMPGKFFEYLAAAKPIFCISDEGPPKKYINDYGIGIVSNDFDIQEISHNLNKLIKSIEAKEFLYPDTTTLKAKFNRKNIASDMALLFNKSLS